MHDTLGAPAYVVAGRSLAHFPAYARVPVRGGVSVPPEWHDELPRRGRCPACARGDDCPAWDWDALAADGVTPRRPLDSAFRPLPAAATERPETARAAETLGLDPHGKLDRGAVLAAHRAAVMRLHPDRGGSTEAMAEANAARDTLLSGLII